MSSSSENKTIHFLYALSEKTKSIIAKMEHLALVAKTNNIPRYTLATVPPELTSNEISANCPSCNKLADDWCICKKCNQWACSNYCYFQRFGKTDSCIYCQAKYENLYRLVQNMDECYTDIVNPDGIEAILKIRGFKKQDNLGTNCTSRWTLDDRVEVVLSEGIDSYISSNSNYLVRVQFIRHIFIRSGAMMIYPSNIPFIECMEEVEGILDAVVAY